MSLLNIASLAIASQDNEFPVGALVHFHMTDKVYAVVAKKDNLSVLKSGDDPTLVAADHEITHATNEQLAPLGIERVELSPTAVIRSGDFWALTDKPGRLRLAGDSVGKFPADFPKSVFYRFCPTR